MPKQKAKPFPDAADVRRALKHLKRAAKVMDRTQPYGAWKLRPIIKQMKLQCKLLEAGQ